MQILVPRNGFHYTYTRNYSLHYSGSPPACNTILQWIQNFQYEGSVENELSLGDLGHQISKNKECLPTSIETQKGHYEQWNMI